MKKFRMLFLIALMVVALSVTFASCDENNSKNNDGSSCSHVSLSDEKVVKDATCEENGLIGGTCEECGAYATHSFSAYGHNIVDGSCTVCGKSE